MGNIKHSTLNIVKPVYPEWGQWNFPTQKCWVENQKTPKCKGDAIILKSLLWIWSHIPIELCSTNLDFRKTTREIDLLCVHYLLEGSCGIKSLMTHVMLYGTTKGILQGQILLDTPWKLSENLTCFQLLQSWISSLKNPDPSACREKPGTRIDTPQHPKKVLQRQSTNYFLAQL